MGVLVVRTVRSAIRVRIVGLAAESAFFSLLSLPALLLGLVGSLGRLGAVLGQETVMDIRAWLLDLAATVLTAHSVDTVVAPMVDDFLRGAHSGALSLTFLLSLWSGSRAMSVFIESISIAYGLEDVRGYVRRRVLAFVAYLGGLLFALVVLPVIVVGPDLLRSILPFAGGSLRLAYWPVVGGLSLICIVALYALSVPVRTPLPRHLPGALLAVVILMLGAMGLRVYLGASFGQASIYGSLSAPIAILVWLYVMALAVLTGSSLNAEIDALSPTPRTAEARARIAARRHASAVRMVERRERALRTLAERSQGDGRGRGEEPGAAPDGEEPRPGGMDVEAARDPVPEPGPWRGTAEPPPPTGSAQTPVTKSGD